MKSILAFFFLVQVLQSPGQEITGKVWGPDYQPLAGSKITVTRLPTYKQTTITDTGGHYSVILPTQGNYDVSFSHWGYNDMLIREVPARNGGKTTQNVVLARKY